MYEGEQHSGGSLNQHSAAVPERLREFLSPIRRISVDDVGDVLKRIVETEVTPRLILAQKKALAASRPRRPSAREATAAEVDRFQVIIVHEELSDCVDFLSVMRDAGVSLQSLYLGLFAPAARGIGARWDRDELSFVDVTMALGRLQMLLHDLPETEPLPRPLDEAKRIILACSGDDQHTLGMLIVSELFRHDGWEVSGGIDLVAGPALDRMVHESWYGVVGLSASTEEKAYQLKSAIESMRDASRNRSIAVLVGGPGFADHPEISTEIGADAVARDGAEALTRADAILRAEKAGRKTR